MFFITQLTKSVSTHSGHWSQEIMHTQLKHWIKGAGYCLLDLMVQEPGLANALQA